MALAAADLGIGTGHSSVGDRDLARKILGVPGDHDVAFLHGVGYPADHPLRPSPSPTVARSAKSSGTAVGSVRAGAGGEGPVRSG